MKTRPWISPLACLAFCGVVVAVLWYPFEGQFLKPNDGERHVIAVQLMLRGHGPLIYSALALLVAAGVGAAVRPGMRVYVALGPFVFTLFFNLWTFRELNAADTYPLSRNVEATWDYVGEKRGNENWMKRHYLMYRFIREIYAGATFVTFDKWEFKPWMAFGVAELANLEVKEYPHTLPPGVPEELLAKYSSRIFILTKEMNLVYLWDPSTKAEGQRYFEVAWGLSRMIIPEAELGRVVAP